MRIYDSLTRKIEDFKPLNYSQVLMYTCGPTVYDYAHIGNFRTYVISDILHRAILVNGYKVNFIMNLTDVGHLSGDNQGDSSTGRDRVEHAAEQEGKSAREITDFYIHHFLADYEKLNLLKPRKFTRATDYITEQIELIKTLEKKGFTYKTADGVYFDTSKVATYGELAGIDVTKIQEGSRVEVNPNKRNAADFALWKLSAPEEKRWQEWDSPWGRGFPGWHLECSAMILKELDETIDIHVGGEDLRMTHHPNEIVQSEAATDKKFVNYWVHSSFLLVDEGRMGKSLGNAYTVSDIEAKGFDPLALRYFYLTAHYRTQQNFTWTALQSADSALKKLYSTLEAYKGTEDAQIDQGSMEKFLSAVNEDLNMPKALAVVWELIKSDLPDNIKLVTILKFDDVLGLNVEKYVGHAVPQRVVDLAKTRQEYRKSGIFDKADLIRREIESLGYVVEDAGESFKIKRTI
jgi:cysteinyl-tRNA synthetase